MTKYSKLISKSTNKILDYLKKMPEIPCGIPADTILAKELEVSRTTVRKVIDVLCEKGIARKDGTNKILLRRPKAADYLNDSEVETSKTDLVEKLILKKLSAYQLKPGDRFSELELSREFDINTVSIREALIKIAKSGIIKKHPRQKWEVVEFNKKTIEEIAAVRKLYEGYAIQAFKNIPANDGIWEALERLKDLHLRLLKKSKITFKELSNTERTFHLTLIKACRNRFIEDSYQSIFILINFHIWQIEYDRPKNERVFKQHLAILDALLNKDFDQALTAMEIHLDHAEESMKNVNHILEVAKNGQG